MSARPELTNPTSALPGTLMDAADPVIALLVSVEFRLARIEDEVVSRLERLERHQPQAVVREAYTIPQAAERLPYSVWTIRRACSTGRIRGVKSRNGRDWRIPHDELLRVEAEGL